MFHHTSGYPKAVIQNSFSKVKKEKQSTSSVNITDSHQDDISQRYLLPYKGKRGGKHFTTLTKK